MAGMGSAIGPQPEEEMAPRQDMPDEGGMSEGQQEASPEEQQLYEMMVKNAMSIIYPEGEQATVSPNVLKALKGSDNPVVNVAAAAVSIVSGLRDSAQKAGVVDQWNSQAQQSGDMLDFDEILFHASEAVVSELAEVAEAAGIADLDEKDLERALYIGLDMYRAQGEKSGAVNNDALKAAWGQAAEAEQQGQLDKLMPGAEAHARKFAEDSQQEEPEE